MFSGTTCETHLRDVLGSSYPLFFFVCAVFFSFRCKDHESETLWKPIVAQRLARIVWWTSISSKESSPSQLRSCSEERQWNRFAKGTEILQSWHQNHKDCRFWCGGISKAPLAPPSWSLRKFRAAAERTACGDTHAVTTRGTSITGLQQHLAQDHVTTNLGTFHGIQGTIETASHYDNDGDRKRSCPKLLHQWHQEKGWSSLGEANIQQ